MSDNHERELIRKVDATNKLLMLLLNELKEWRAEEKK
jgi:hypothetical protein